MRKNILGNTSYERNIHSSDTFSETLSMAQSVFNENSLFFLNYSPIFSETNLLINIKGLNFQSAYMENVCLTGSSTLEAFGIRKASDIDLVQGVSPIDNPTHQHQFQNNYSHSELFPSYGEKIYDPRNFMYIDGIKFLSLHSCLIYKLKRSEKKDIRDVELIYNFLKSNENEIYSNSNNNLKLSLKINKFLQSIGIERKLKSKWYQLVQKINKVVNRR